MLYSHNGNYPTLLPDSLLSSTEEEIIQAGYVLVIDPPISVDSGYELYWRNNEWVLVKEHEAPILPDLPPLE
jgi:hypothetical protein